MKTTIFNLFTVSVFALTAFALGCKDLWEKDDDELIIKGSSSASGTEDFNEQTSDYEFDENGVRYIHCNTTSITLENCDTTVSVSGQTATINSEGTYFVDGVLNDGQIKVNAEGLVQIVLNGANLSCKESEPLFIKDCEKAVVILNDETSNSLSSFRTKVNTAFSGAGILTINAEDEDAIKAKKNIIFRGGVFNLSCVSTVSANDTAKNDAIQADGNVEISDGVFNITTKAKNHTSISKQGWGGGFPGDGGFNPGGGGFGSMEGSSNKLAGMNGITCGGNLTISGGDFTINAYGKGFNADGDIAFSNATAVITAERHGVGADGSFTIESGKLDITSSWEGIEATNIYISGGETYIDAQDDGINASNTKPSINISDGFLFVKALGDGIDSNGDIKVSGGVTVVSQTGGGNSPIDCGDGGYTFTVSGGTIFAMGSSDMFSESIPSSTSNPMVYSTALGNSSSSLSVGDLIAIKNPQTYGAAIFISDKLTNGQKYSFVVGGTVSGSEYKSGTGIYFPAESISGGKSVSVTATTQGGRGGGFGW